MCSRSADERGSVSAFVACVTGVLVLCGIFVVENGRFAAEYLRVSDVAENAARIGSQSIVGIRAGDPHIDVGAARASAVAYMHDQGVRGSVSLTGSGHVEVHAFVAVGLPGLARLGVPTRTITIVRTARTVDG